MSRNLRMDGPGRARPDASEEWLDLIDRLYAIASSGMVLGLERVERVLGALGHPERNFPAIHVAGTNGKGSTCAFLSSILAASGRTTGLYTSPHLVSLEERVQVVTADRARPIDPSDLLRSFRAVEEVAPDFGDLTFFEVITVAGLHALAARGVDVAVVEAGLGARLDATRLVEAVVSVLTDLSLEHTAILGATIEAIATEKSAVIRSGRPIVAADGPPGALAIIERTAREQGAPLALIGRDLSFTRNEDGTHRFVLLDRTLDGARLSLLGPHQGRNALLALQAALHFDPSLDDATLRHGLATTRWPGRMEVIRRPGRPPVLLDGAHNAQGAEALARGLRAHAELFAPPLHLVFGVLGDKDANEMLEHLAPLAASVALTRADSPRSREPASLLPLLPPRLQGADLAASTAEGVAIAEDRAARDGGWVVVAGSLYLVGEARALLLPDA